MWQGFWVSGDKIVLLGDLTCFTGNCSFEWGPKQTVLPVRPCGSADPMVLEVHVVKMLFEA